MRVLHLGGGGRSGLGRADTSGVTVCVSCGHENQPGGKFCSECGAALAQAEAPRREERKIVTVLFAELVDCLDR